MAVISFKPKQATKKLLSVLPERSRDVIEKRFGLLDEDRLTLDAIGQIYGITRERVRQIENFALNSIKKSDAFADSQSVFDELETLIESLGGVIAEDNLFEHISKDERTQNHINLFLVLGDPFMRNREDEHFKHRWFVNKNTADSVHNGLKKLYSELSADDLVSEQEILNKFLNNLKDISDEHRTEESARRFLSMSKKIDVNPLGEWGMADSPNIRARGMRDYAFLVIRRHGNPMHFREVAKAIEDIFGKRAHQATCHNELIKDSRFVLVGRGLYALSDWGYMSGVVRDVVKKILKKHGPLNKKNIIDKVLKERYVKPNTIVVNLQNPKHFKKNKDGTYALV